MARKKLAIIQRATVLKPISKVRTIFNSGPRLLECNRKVFSPLNLIKRGDLGKPESVADNLNQFSPSLNTATATHYEWPKLF